VGVRAFIKLSPNSEKMLPYKIKHDTMLRLPFSLLDIN
jgi:hypothetical protein